MIPTCADHGDDMVLGCEACKAALHALRGRARKAGRTVAEQAIDEGRTLMRLGQPVRAAHRLRLAWRDGIESGAEVLV